jgi:RNA polymerase sigma factor (sigma-70 family)
LNEEELALTIQAAEQPAPRRALLEELWGRLRSGVRRSVGFRGYARTTGMTEADLEQEAFMAFAHAVLHFDPARASVRTLVVNAVQNHFRDLARRWRLRQTCSLVEEQVPGSTDGHSGMTAQARHDLQEAIWSTLEELDAPLEQRLAFYLRELRGWSNNRLAEAFAVSPAATSRWHSQVREQFAVEFPRRHPEYFQDVPADLSAIHGQPILDL